MSDRHAEAARLDRLAVNTGDTRFHHAAAILRGRKAGRPEVDDTAPLGLARQLLADKLVNTEWAAALAAARMSAPVSEVQSMAHRLWSKLKKEKESSESNN